MRAPSGYHWSQQTSAPMRAVACVEAAKAEIARREVILFEVERIVGDVHLAILAEQRAVGVEDDRGVVIHARRPPFEHRADDDDLQLRGQP